MSAQPASDAWGEPPRDHRSRPDEVPPDNTSREGRPRAAAVGRGPARALPHRQRHRARGRRGELDVRPGETLGIVGESGSGKSVSAMTIMGLVAAPPARFPSGRILLRGEDLLTATDARLRSLRGKEVSMIFQDPLTALNPVFKVGSQIAEVIRVHEPISRSEAKERAVELLGEVGIPNPRGRARRVSAPVLRRHAPASHDRHGARAEPRLLLADEPTTALDVTVQAQIMDLLEELQEQRGTAIVLITHDLGLVASHADRVLVMYAGRVAEYADTDGSTTSRATRTHSAC